MTAFCTKCPLKHSGTGDPVGPEIHSNDQVIIIGDFPGIHETVEGRPFVGPGGVELQRALDRLDLKRFSCHLTNALCCRPPKNDLEATNIQISRKNKGKSEEERVLKPAEACRGRLYRELQATGIHKIICLGKEAARAIRQKEVSVMKIRGGCEEVPAGIQT